MAERSQDPNRFRKRLSEGDERPFRDYFWYELASALEENRDDVFVLRAIVVECATRTNKKAERVRDTALARLKELLALGFPDEPEGTSGEGVIDTESWPDEGLLAHLGYRVGQRDPGTLARHRILSRVFEGPIPNVIDPEYMRQWGSDASVPRLYKLSSSIWAFASNRLKYLGGTADAAVTTWAGDLDWLRDEYYEGHFGFPWPDLDY